MKHTDLNTGQLSISEWGLQESFREHFIFTRANVESAFPTFSAEKIVQSLRNLSERGIIYSPWQNFYVIIPTEYRLKGVVPLVFYIDQLMSIIITLVPTSMQNFIS